MAMYKSLYDIQIEKMIEDINNYKKGILHLTALLEEYGIEIEEVNGGMIWKRT